MLGAAPGQLPGLYAAQIEFRTRYPEARFPNQWLPVFLLILKSALEIAFHTVGDDAFAHSRALIAHLHLMQIEDDASPLLYVWGTTGEAVRDVPRAKRLWNYAGAWIHWLYLLRGGVFDAYWPDIANRVSIGHRGHADGQASARKGRGSSAWALR